MNPRQHNYWLSTAEMPETDFARPLSDRADVAIIGAGYTGLSAALALAQRGASVAVLESQTIGWGASSRNGGMVLTGLKLSLEKLISKYGRERAQRMHSVSLASINCVERIVREQAIDCDFARCGHLEVACKPQHFAGFERQAEVIARDFHHEVRLVPRGDLQSEIGSSIYFGGLVDEFSAGLNPARYVSGLAWAAMKAGAAVFENARVERIERNANGWRLNTAKGLLQTREVLVATSGYTGAATPFLRKKIVPIGSYIIVTETLPESLAHVLSPRSRMIYDSKYYLYYYRLTPDRRMLFGGRAAFFPETENTVNQSAEILRRGMIQVYPQLRQTKVEYVWGGTLDFAFDMAPHAGQTDGVYFALGYAGHGVAMATWQGQTMAEMISGQKPDNPFAEIPFPGAPLGLYDGRPWFLPFAGTWYKFLDWIS
jgi:glycine/D-amino acid oxidase-like deaminating enzyme